MAEITEELIKQVIDLLKDILLNRDVSTTTGLPNLDATKELLASLTQKSTMSKCHVRFYGQYDHDAVEEFINGVETFKELEQISNEDALKGISLLFKDTASTWWQGIKKQAETWQECIQLIREHFSPKKSAYQLYMEIFESAQNDKSINAFVIDKRNLLAQLPEGRHDETTEIDFIYGLLNIKYRQFMRREDVKTFCELLEKGRYIELNNLELANNEMANQKPKRCAYCNYRGHTAEDCRKRQQTSQHKIPADSKNTGNIKESQ